MNLITAQLSHRQAIIVKDIAQTKIRELIIISSDHDLLKDIPKEQKETVVSKLLRDFSRLIQSPFHLFNTHEDTQSLFRHELFQITYSGPATNYEPYPMDEVRGLWRKISAAEAFTHNQLN